MEMRFIEFMPLDAENQWQHDQVLVAARKSAGLIEEAIGPLEPAARPDPSQPATDFRFADGGGTIGFINPVTQPFCEDCNRLRMTAEGQDPQLPVFDRRMGRRGLCCAAAATDEELTAARARLRPRQEARPRHRLGRFRAARAGHVSDWEWVSGE